jgi:hypothetical protein
MLGMDKARKQREAMGITNPEAATPETVGGLAGAKSDDNWPAETEHDQALTTLYRAQGEVVQLRKQVLRLEKRGVLSTTLRPVRAALMEAHAALKKAEESHRKSARKASAHELSKKKPSKHGGAYTIGDQDL